MENLSDRTNLFNQIYDYIPWEYMSIRQIKILKPCIVGTKDRFIQTMIDKVFKLGETKNEKQSEKSRIKQKISINNEIKANGNVNGNVNGNANANGNAMRNDFNLEFEYP